jgi:hypothetical protein
VKRAAYPQPHRELAVAIHRVAALRAAQGRNDEADKLYAEAVRVYEQALGPENADLRAALQEYAEFAKNSRRTELARSLQRRAKAIHSFQ